MLNDTFPIQNDTFRTGNDTFVPSQSLNLL